MYNKFNLVVIQLISVLLLFFITGCASFNKPSTVYVPHIKNKGDIEVRGALNNIIDFNINAFYAFDDQYALLLKAGYMNNKGLPFTFTYIERYAKSNHVELGIGRYGNDMKEHFNYFIGVGTGYKEFGTKDIYEEPYVEDKIWSDYVNVFYQAGYIMDLTNRTSLVLFSRFNYTYNYNVKTENTFWERKNNIHMPYLEPGFAFHFNPGPNVILDLTMMYSTNLSDLEYRRTWNMRSNLFFVFGVSYVIN